MLKGAKQFVTAARSAAHVVTFAVTGEKKRTTEALSAFLVPTDSPGYVVGKREDTFGMRSSDTCEVFFDELRLPASARIGERGAAIGSRPLTWIAVESASLPRRSASRVPPGKPPLATRSIARRSASRSSPIRRDRFRIADMAMELHAARLLVEDAARRLDAGQSCTKESSMAKLYASEMAERVTHDAMQVLGGYGYLKEFAVERYYRDARVCSIYEGTSDIQRMLIGNAVIEELQR